MVERFIHVRQEHPDGWRISPVATPTGDFVHYSDYANLERQIAELRAERDEAVEREREKSQMLAIETHHAEAAEAENARLRALPLKDEVERAFDNLLVAYAACNGEDHPAYVAARVLLSRLRAGVQEGWRSIEIAPKDGENILYRNKFRDIGFCHWDEGYDEGDQPCWWDNEADQEVCPVIWLPADILPAFPAAPSNQGGDRG